MNYITIIGFIAAAFTSTAFAPQVYKAWKLKETKDVSFLMVLMLTVGVLLWIVYGLLRNDIVIIIANVVTLVLASTVLIFKIKYG